MNPRTLIVSLLAIFSVAAGTGVVISQEAEKQKIKIRKVRRVKRPKFAERDWDGVYFENLFQDGLVGKRPTKIEKTEIASTARTPTNTPNEAVTSETTGWSNIVPAFVVEDEIKKIQRELNQQITSPIKFKSDYGEARQSFSMLSLLFAVVREYDKDIRWKRAASKAQVAFARTAANARVGSQQAYQSAKTRKEALDELVRGGNFETNEEIPETLAWELVIDRSPTMVKLEEALKLLKPMFANKTEFNDNVETIEHEASLIAVIGDVLTREAMDDWDEDDYVVHAQQMKNAAVTVATGARNSNFEAAATAFNTISQSCSNCHEEWR